LIQAVEDANPPSTFLQDLLVKKSTSHDTKYIELDKISKGNRIAGYVNRASDAQQVDKPGFDSRLHVIPYTKEMMTLTPEDLEIRNPGTTIYASGNPRSTMNRKMGEWLGELDKRIIRLEEVQTAAGLTTGTVVVSGVGESYTITFGRDAGNTGTTLTGTARWGESADDITQNLRDGAAQMRAPGINGGSPTVLLLGKTCAEKYMDDTALADKLDNRRIEQGTINPRQLAGQSADYLGYYSDIGLNVDVYCYHGQYVNAAGVDTYYIGEHNMYLINTNLRVEKHYSMIFNLKSNFVGPRFPLMWVEDNGTKAHVQLESGPLVAFHEPNKVYMRQVTS
jgi:hypothetical protein